MRSASGMRPLPSFSSKFPCSSRIEMRGISVLKAVVMGIDDAV
jgi:hypothetical protein